MSVRIVRRVAPGLIAGLIAAFAIPGHQARAQAALPSPTGVGPVVKGGNGGVAAQPSVAGLPGARKDTVVKGAINASLLSPNDELFDAIDRGDLAAARDAVARGADLDATNAVGQKPIDESVALGRNDITFLLVTLLHAGGGNITDAQGPMAQPPANTLGLSSKDQKAASTPVSFFGTTTPSTKPRKKTRYQATQPAPAHTVPMAAASYPASSGTPVPAAGFVGFGATAQ